jgi:uncharacterized protein YjbI with pentapeptide repeats
MEKPTRASIEQRVRKGEDLARIDLRQVNLAGAKLSGAKLARADLEGANLENADLSNADLSGASLREAFAAGAILNNAQLKKADLDGAVLRQAKMRKVDLSRANLEGTNLEGADLGKAKFRYAQLDSANLATAVLTGANLSQADLSNACLAGVRADRANFSRADLSEASLEEASLRDAVLDEAVLRGVKGKKAKLRGASLLECDLENAVLDGADFSRADLRRARLSGARLAKTVLDSAKIFGIDCGQSIPEGAIAQRCDVSREGDGSRLASLQDFLENPAGKERSDDQSLRRYVGPGDTLRNAELSFESGAEVQVDGLLEHCELNLAGDASLIIGESGILDGCRVVGGRVQVNGCFLERSRVGLERDRARRRALDQRVEPVEGRASLEGRGASGLLAPGARRLLVRGPAGPHERQRGRGERDAQDEGVLGQGCHRIGPRPDLARSRRRGRACGTRAAGSRGAALSPGSTARRPRRRGGSGARAGRPPCATVAVRAPR